MTTENNEVVHLNSTPNKKEIEHQDLAIDDIICKLKKVTTEKGRMVITIETDLFTPSEAGALVTMQQQEGLCTIALQSVPPEHENSLQ
jgi:hypothetical protein